jgi:hypothetical protein
LAASEKVDLCANTPYVSMPSHGILCYAMLYYVMLYYNMLSRAIYLPSINTSYYLMLHDETWRCIYIYICINMWVHIL